MTEPRKRDKHGRWLPGFSPNPKGRLPRVTEKHYYELMRGGIKDEDFVAIVEYHVKIAQGVNPEEGGKRKVTPAEARGAAKMLFDYLVPSPAALHEHLSMRKEDVTITVHYGDEDKEEKVIVEGEVIEKDAD